MRVFFLISILALQLFSQNIESNDKEFKIGLTDSWPPFNFSQNNKIEGMAVDYWNLIEKKAGLKAQIIKTNNFSQVLEKIKSKGYDLTVNTTYTKERAEYAVFSKTYEFFPIGVVSKSNIEFIPKLSLLKGRKIAVGREYSAYYLLKDRYPMLDFMIVNNTQEALDLVKEGKAFAAVDILPVLQHYLFNLETNNLRVNGISDVNFELQIMLNKKHENLLPIINKAIDSITQEERNEIYTKRLLNPDIQRVDLTFIYQVGTLALILLLIFIYWNLKLRKAKEQINEEKNKLNEILSNLPIPILIVDKKTKKILFANEYASTLYKIEHKELLGNLIDVLYVSNHQREDILGAMSPDGSLINFETRFKLQDGTVIDGLLSYLPLVYDDKSCRMGVVADITELKDSQKQLKFLNEKLEEKVEIAVNKYKEQQILLFQQSRLAQMGEMISMIAHQWRQPLNILSLIIQTIEMKYKDKTLEEQYFDELIDDSTNQIKLMSKTVEDFMNFFKPDKKVEIFDVNKQIKTSTELLDKLLLSKNINTKLNLDGSINVSGYPNEFGQVVINLIANAKDAIEEKNILNGVIEVDSKTIDNKVIIEIKDNAKGIDELLIDKIFNPYFSTKSEKNGTGLGLYMSKLIIEEHMNGKISVKNLEKGACFTIELELSK